MHSQATAIHVPELQAEIGRAYARQGPLGTVTRSLYIPYPSPKVSSVLTAGYTGHRDLRRYEVLTYQVFDDVYQDAERRVSEDNGRTWSPWQPDPECEIRTRETSSWQRFAPAGPTEPCHDPQSGRLVQPYAICSFSGDPRQVGRRECNYHVLWRTSADDGRTWRDGAMVRYEDGPELSLERIRDAQFLATNFAVYYHNTLPLEGGGLIFATDAQVAVTSPDGTADRLDGIRCFLGTWDREIEEYRWIPSEALTLPRSVSMYLAEPWLARLADGRLLLDIRGMNLRTATPNAPGRHWHALSPDEGRTWSEVTDWRYDDGQQFYSPATMAKLLRHSRTEKLYWFGNICPRQPIGNTPRHPFYIAEVDEELPALRRDSLTVIDDYDPARHSPKVQFSNFSVFENRETGQFELYLSPYGEYEDSEYTASVYRYTVSLRDG